VKKYEVVLTPDAETGMISAFDYIYEASPTNAEKWLKRLYARIYSLENFPARCARAREQEYFKVELRQLIFKSHRIVFHIDEKEKTVWILYVIHGKQHTIGAPTELEAAE